MIKKRFNSIATSISFIRPINRITCVYRKFIFSKWITFYTIFVKSISARSKYNYSYYDLRKPYYIFLDRIARHIIGYPDIEGYLKKASRSYYQYYKFTNKVNPFKKILLGGLEKINHKKYLNNNHSYKDLKTTYAALINKSLALIEAVNKLLYFDKDKDLFDLIDTYLL